MLDLDRFKNVNDSLGHPEGDALLKETAQRLKSALRETDVLARLGGDEFAILQAGEANQWEDASSLADPTSRSTSAMRRSRRTRRSARRSGGAGRRIRRP